MALRHTGSSAPDESKRYRIRVLLGSLLLGFADADVLADGSDKDEVDADQLVVVKDGRTVPIRFRIEQGVLDGLFATVRAGATTPAL